MECSALEFVVCLLFVVYLLFIMCFIYLIFKNVASKSINTLFTHVGDGRSSFRVTVVAQ
jgi:hypothetical protein